MLNGGARVILDSIKNRTPLEWGLILFAFVLPLSVASETILFCCLAVWLCSVLRDPRVRWKDLRSNSYLVPVIAFAVVALLTILWSVRPAETLQRVHRLLIPCVILLMGDVYRRPSSRTSGVLEPIFAFLCGCAVLGLYDLFRIPRTGLSHGALFQAGNMRDPQMYLVGLCLLLAVGASNIRREWIPLIWSGAALFSGGILLHFKRGVWFSIAAVFALFSLLTKAWRLSALLGAIAAVVFLIPSLRQPICQRVSDVQDLWDKDVGGRYALWMEVAPKLLPQYPLGMGYCAVVNEDFAEHTDYVQAKLDHMHNNLLQITLETGIAGALTWLLWMGTALVVMCRHLNVRSKHLSARLRIGLLSAFVGLMLNGMVEYNFGDTEILMLLCFLMGASVSEPVVQNNECRNTK